MCQHYHTSSIIIHSSKLMLKVLQNRFKPQAENVIAEEQACFRDGRSTKEHVIRDGGVHKNTSYVTVVHKNTSYVTGGVHKNTSSTCVCYV